MSFRSAGGGLSRHSVTAKASMAKTGAGVAHEGATRSIDYSLDSFSKQRMRVPNRLAQSEIDGYIARSSKLFSDAGGTFVPNPGPAPGVFNRTFGRMNYNKKTIELFDGHEIQEVVEELAHFRQSVRDGYWGTDRVISESERIDWEKQIDLLFKTLGFVPR